MAEIEVVRATAVIPISDEVLAMGRETALGVQSWLTATPEERARLARDADVARQREREAASTVLPLTLDALLDRLNFTREYAEHLVQPYCYCSDTADGWDYCQHARDLGLTP